MPKFDPRARLVLRDALVVAGIAVLVFQALRRGVADKYPVPSGSMEPTLHGDEADGDVVLVDKLADASSRRRHDLVVVAHPHDGRQQLVKRIAARGDDVEACWIDIRDGDVWLGPDRQQVERERKDPLGSRPLRALWAAAPGTDPEQAALLELGAARGEGAALALPALGVDAGTARALFREDVLRQRRDDPSGRVTPAGFLGTARAVDTTFVPATGLRGRARDGLGVRDCGMDLAVAQLPEALLCTVDDLGEALTFHWRPATGEVALWRNGADVATANLPPCGGGAHRVEFGHLDDRMFLAVDGRADALVCVARGPAWNPGGGPPAWPREPRVHVHVGALGARELRLSALAVFRDLHAQRDRNASLPGTPGSWPRFVAPGCWFLLGDNALDSRDSRHFDSVPASAFLGRPVAVLGPWPRTRWLAQ